MSILKSVVSATGDIGAAKALERFFYAVTAAWLFGALTVASIMALSLYDLRLIGFVLAAIVVIAAGVALFASWAELYGQRSRDLRAQQIFAALQRGETPPPFTLYLRPFASTGTFTQTSSSMIGAGALGGETTELEAQMERAVRPLGPLVALGAPLEHIGAGRIKVGDDAWRKAVDMLMPHARLIVMLPSSRAGTLAEIDMILKSNLIRRTVMIDPPNIGSRKKFNQSAEWAKVQQAFRAAQFELPPDSHDGALYFYGDRRKPRLQEKLDINADDRIERLFRRVVKICEPKSARS